MKRITNRDQFARPDYDDIHVDGSFRDILDHHSRCPVCGRGDINKGWMSTDVEFRCEECECIWILHGDGDDYGKVWITNYGKLVADGFRG